jgi:hypothetical protein
MKKAELHFLRTDRVDVLCLYRARFAVVICDVVDFHMIDFTQIQQVWFNV